MPFVATWMDLEIVIPHGVSQADEEKSITYTRDLKTDTNELTYKTETDSQTQRVNLWLPGGKCG